MNQLAIGIPTRHRRDMLLELLDDIVQYAPHLPVVISDNSLDDETEIAIAHYQNRLNINYFHIKDSLSQAENFNFLLKQIKAKYALLMHDDDRFIPCSFPDYQEIIRYLEEHSLEVFAVYVKGLKFRGHVPAKAFEISKTDRKTLNYVRNHLRIFSKNEYIDHFVEHGNGGRAAGMLVNWHLMSVHNILFSVDVGAKHDKAFFLTTNRLGAVAYWQKRSIAVRLHEKRSIHKKVTENYVLFNHKLEQIYGYDSSRLSIIHRERFHKWRKSELGFAPLSCLALLASARLPLLEKARLFISYCGEHIIYDVKSTIPSRKS